MAAPAKQQLSPGRQFRTFFLAACLDIHECAGGDRYGLLVDAIGVGEHSIKEFEKGNTFPTTNLDQYAAGYTVLATDLTDARDLFDRALDWWRQHGKRPLTSSELRGRPREKEDEITPQEVIRLIRSVQALAPAEPRPTAKRSRRAVGG